jgi:hypothetical protein
MDEVSKDDGEEVVGPSMISSMLHQVRMPVGLSVYRTPKCLRRPGTRFVM